MALRDVVDVQILRQTASITRVGFGTLAFIYDTTTVPSARVLTFGSADEVDVSTNLTATAKAALTAAFAGQLVPVRVKAIYRLTGQADPADNETYLEALSEAQAVDEDWYAVAIQSRLDDDIMAVASWVESRKKIFVAATADVTILDPIATTDIASRLLTANYSRTALIYSAQAATTWPDTTWAGGQLPNDPGSVTWAFKALPGIPGSVFPSAQISALEAKRATRLETILGLSRTIGGYTSEPGAFVDIIRGIDWLAQTMAEDIFVLLAQSPKVPYTNEGIAMIETVVRSRLQVAVNRNVIADDESLTVSTPDVSETSTIDRANRVLRDVRFTARLAGALHRVIVRGVVSV